MKEFANTKTVAEFISYAVAQTVANTAETLHRSTPRDWESLRQSVVPLSPSLGTVTVAAFVVGDSLALRKWWSFPESEMGWHSRVS